ncbi:hypothetical protein L596_025710 [Steinernema carpocapsae]|uniref:Uncharacterized protein n=1 Tax=Steinernema carpocapsae TaxID=34508 RepID=A0A4U5M9F0_STECR|nr:hypothetical protein L596_025710 [Steinernema carpocapsae]
MTPNERRLASDKSQRKLLALGTSQVQIQHKFQSCFNSANPRSNEQLHNAKWGLENLFKRITNFGAWAYFFLVAYFFLAAADDVVRGSCGFFGAPWEAAKTAALPWPASPAT